MAPEKDTLFHGLPSIIPTLAREGRGPGVGRAERRPRSSCNCISASGCGSSGRTFHSLRRLRRTWTPTWVRLSTCQPCSSILARCLPG